MKRRKLQTVLDEIGTLLADVTRPPRDYALAHAVGDLAVLLYQTLDNVATARAVVEVACEIRASTGPGKVLPSYQPGVVWTDLRECLPEYTVETIREAIPRIDRNLRGFALEDAVMTGVETRSSAPVRIPRDPQSLECTCVRRFYPAGEGAGYAGGIISAAADGMRVAEAILREE